MSDGASGSTASGVARRVIGAAVVLVAVGALAVGLVRERARNAEPVPVPVAPAAEGPGIVTVYYFHGDARCKTCLAIEAQTTEVVRRAFADEIAGGIMRFEVVNFDEPANRHFLDDYGLAYGTVVVQGAGESGGWEDLADVWTYVHAEGTAFEDYLVDHIRRMLDTPRMTAALLTAAWLGLLTAISPCPLATNIAAVSFLGRHAEKPGRALWSGGAYVLGRTLCYMVLAGVLAAGLLAAATASAAFGRMVGLLVGPILILAGAMLLGLLPAPSLGAGAGKLSGRLGARGDAAGAFLLGVVFALSFCPASAAIFFGSLVPLAARSRSPVAVPVVYGVATGIPVLVFACMIAAGSHHLGKAFDRTKAVERWLRALTGAVLMAVGLYLCLRTNLGL